MLGLILPDISNPFYAELAKTIEDAVDHFGYSLVLGNSAGSSERELRYVRTFVDRKVDGLFMISGSSSQDLTVLSSEIDIPFIIIDRRLNYMQNAFLFTTDNRKGAAIAVNHLLALGHVRIVALCGPVHLGNERATGYEIAMRDAGHEPRIYRSEAFDRKSSFSTAIHILSGTSRPTAIFAANDLAGISALRAAADLNIAVPRDLAIVGYDNIQEGEFSQPRLTTIAQPTDELGAVAVRHLMGLIEKTVERRFGIEMIEPRLVVRESCGAYLRLGENPIRPYDSDPPLRKSRRQSATGGQP